VEFSNAGYTGHGAGGYREPKHYDFRYSRDGRSVDLYAR
jgi:hypothetical protein